MGIPGASGNSPVLMPVAASGAYNGPELAVDLIQAQVQANILQALANVRGEREDPIVTTEIPKEYFQYEMAEGYRLPAIFTIIQDMDFRTDNVKANHLNTKDRILVAAVVEDRKKTLVTKKAYRYQSALMQCLHLVTLTSGDGTLRLFSRVQRCSFSGIVDVKDEKSAGAVFRKEVSLQLIVEHVENLV